MIYKRGWQRTISEYELKKYLDDEGVDNPGHIARLIVGCYDDRWHQFTLIDNTYESGKTTLLQRINRIWFVPIYLLTVPFQWVIKGDVGMDNDSKLAKLLMRITGLR